MPLLVVRNLPEGHERFEISSGAQGTAETIDKMQEMVSEGKRNFATRVKVGELIRTVPPKDYAKMADRIFSFCQKDIKYAFDPSGVELVESPERMLQSGIADCDSICVLFASMCESIGLPCRFVTIKADTARPDEFSHVYAEVQIPRKGWVSADCTMQFPFGWSPGAKFPKKRWPASKDQYDSHDTDEMAGMNYLADSIPGVQVGTDSTYGITEFSDLVELDPYTRRELERDTYGNPVHPFVPPDNPWGANLRVPPDYGLTAPSGAVEPLRVGAAAYPNPSALPLGYLGAAKLPKPGIGGVKMIPPNKLLQRMYKGEIKQSLMDLMNKHEGENRNVLMNSQQKINNVTNAQQRAVLLKMWQPAWNINAQAGAAARTAVAAYGAVVKAITENGGGNDAPPAFLAGFGAVDNRTIREFTKIDPIENALMSFNEAYKTAQELSKQAEGAVDEMHDRLYNADKKTGSNNVIYAVAVLALFGGAFAVYKAVDWKNVFSGK